MSYTLKASKLFQNKKYEQCALKKSPYFVQKNSEGYLH